MIYELLAYQTLNIAKYLGVVARDEGRYAQGYALACRIETIACNEDIKKIYLQARFSYRDLKR